MPERINMIVTEVTIYGADRCVAGWDYEMDRMVRPEPGPAKFWPAIYCGMKSTFHPGHLVSFDAEKPETDLPHRSEDWVVIPNSLTEHGAGGSDLFRAACAKSLMHGPSQVYRKHLHFQGDKAFVPTGSDCGSLCGMDLPESDVLLFVETDSNGREKLRARLPVLGRVVNLSITAKDLKQAFKNSGGLEAVKALLANASSFHVRLGLAREMNGDGRCYLQINGIYPVA